MGLSRSHRFCSNNCTSFALLWDSQPSLALTRFSLVPRKLFTKSSFPPQAEELGFDMDPQTTVADFEQAALNAISSELGPHVNTKACFYHLTQSTWRKVQHLGLANRDKEDEETKLFCGMLDGLAFPPVDRVEDGMDFLRDNSPDGLGELIDYFDSTYVSGTVRRRRRVPALCPPEKWNVHQATMDNEPRTNNLCESWNRAFKQLLGYSHPTIWQAIDCIRKDALVVRTHLQNDARGQPLKKRARRDTTDLQMRLRTLCQDFRDGRKSLEEMLRGVGQNIRLL